MFLYKNKPCNNGFTLVEMSLVIGIIAFLVITSTTIGLSRIEATRQSSTKERMEFIMAAVNQFVDKTGRLPCPADAALAKDDADLGLEQVNNAAGAVKTCDTTGTGVTAYSTFLVSGAVPTKTLGIPDTMMFDGWQMRIRYIVAQNQVNKVSTSLTTIYVRGLDTNNVTFHNKTDNAAVILISHGKNKHGAWINSGASIFDPTGGGFIDDNNALTNTNVFYSAVVDPRTDDLVIFKEQSQLGSNYYE